MDINKQTLDDILNIAKNIFELKEKLDSQEIFKNKIFLINEKDISIEFNDSKDNSYYFEHPEIEGFIIKKENNIDYCIKASVQYINSEGKKWWFAKVRIDNYFKEIHINGRRTGSWQMDDFEDDNLIKKTDCELPLVLESMKNSLSDIYNELCENIKLNDNLYSPEWVKKVKKYNN